MFNHEEKLKSVFSNNLKRLMADNDCSETAISENTLISQSAINRIKNGVVSPTLYQAIKLAEFFKVNLSALLVEEQNNDQGNKYIPVIDSKYFLKNGKEKIDGFYESDHSVDNLIALKFDNSFSCKLLKNDSIVIIKNIPKKIKNGSTVLFLNSEKYMIGRYLEHHINPIDDLIKTIQLSEIKLIGEIVKIETTYIKEKHLVENILQLYKKRIREDFLAFPLLAT